MLIFTAIMNAYRGDAEAINTAAQHLQAQAIAQAENLLEAVNALRQQCAGSLLTKDEEAKVKDDAKQTLAALKAEKLKIDRWRESIQVTAQVKVLIDHHLKWLPPETYPDEEVDIKSLLVYQHIYANYQGAGQSRYG